MKKYIVLLFLSLCFISQGYSADEVGRKIKVLIVDGQNNHDVWPKSTIMMKQYLEETGKFTVDIARTHFLHKSEKYKDWLDYANVEEGEEGQPITDPDFNPKFSKYDVIISNFGYKAAPWPEKTQKAFEEFIAKGGGFVSVHAADNSFPEWEAYNEMIGIGGWGGRTEKSGPYLYLDENDNPKKDYTPGPGGKHGKREDFAVTNYNEEHPITKGLPKVWMHANDECYAMMRGPANNVSILSTAVSTLKDAALKQKEPVIMTINYKKGRIFHTTLGHDVEAFECVGFITFLNRGVEWAATGKVTQTEVPSDFPTATKVSKRNFTYKK
ncbi:trehalose utilisation protein ThuA-like protein [Formosa agariphila KMM 3901]|uniref:Trehalose utilisation protein ThuA-like protein n=1 Tax=Formosa agariphila (strain DSM 15362 / KCTC 12365 / LMG 23005 / KMM 3901 / M-2Alg 35-1) TaxID=1347342 RepID=T2KGY3_FORAG|nr:ThuA domain-containing protein [Formosa agariphila]CDF78045.1 trehalose utilisation protein ThuA-like protein [Formosa agariphila KMM 3901]